MGKKKQSRGHRGGGGGGGGAGAAAEAAAAWVWDPALCELLSALPEGAEVAVVTMRGSLCPITVGHVDMFREARSLLLDHPDRKPAPFPRPAGLPAFAECVGMITLNGTQHVDKKLRPLSALNLEARAHLVDLATTELAWLSRPPTQGSHNASPDRVAEHLARAFPELRFTVFDMNGADDVIKYKKWWHVSDEHRMIVMGRPGDTERLWDEAQAETAGTANAAPSANFIAGPEMDPHSSSAARSALAHGLDDARGAALALLGPAVLAWHQANAWSYRAGAQHPHRSKTPALLPPPAAGPGPAP